MADADAVRMERLSTSACSLPSTAAVGDHRGTARLTDIQKGISPILELEFGTIRRRDTHSVLSSGSHQQAQGSQTQAKRSSIGGSHTQKVAHTKQSTKNEVSVTTLRDSDDYCGPERLHHTGAHPEADQPTQRGRQLQLRLRGGGRDVQNRNQVPERGGAGQVRLRRRWRQAARDRVRCEQSRLRATGYGHQRAAADAEQQQLPGARPERGGRRPVPGGPEHLLQGLALQQQAGPAAPAPAGPGRVQPGAPAVLPQHGRPAGGRAAAAAPVPAAAAAPAAVLPAGGTGRAAAARRLLAPEREGRHQHRLVLAQLHRQIEWGRM